MSGKGFDLARIRIFPLYACPKLLFLLIAVLVLSAASGRAQKAADNGYYAPKNSLKVFGAYAPDSSHILLGAAENRQLLSIGAAYDRRLFVNNVVNWQYSGEIIPVALESDPMSLYVYHQTSPSVQTITTTGEPIVWCAPFNGSYSFVDPNGVTYAGTYTISCRGRQWNIGEAMSPVGMQWNFLPRGKTQLFLEGHGGYMYSTKPIPISGAGSFNFTFDIGAGVELFHSKARSISAEYRYHHISNHETAYYNPGIDNGLIQVTYSFGLGH